MPTVLIEVISRYHDSDKPTYKALLDIPEGSDPDMLFQVGTQITQLRLAALDAAR